MLTINGTSPKQILFNGTDLTKVYARATAADTPVLVWTKYAISITGNRFYLGDAIHNQIRIFQNGTLKDTIAAGFSGNKDLSFTLASGNTLIVQIYNSTNGWSQNIYNGTVSSSTWYYENFTETTHEHVIPNGNVECVSYHWYYNWHRFDIRWPDLGVTANWTLRAEIPCHNQWTGQSGWTDIEPQTYTTTDGQQGPIAHCELGSEHTPEDKRLRFYITTSTSGGNYTLDTGNRTDLIPEMYDGEYSPGPNIPFAGLTFRYYTYDFN